MAWEITLTKVALGDGIIGIRLDSVDTPPLTPSDSFCGSASRTYKVERQREDESWVSVNPSLGSFPWTDTSMYHDGDYKYRVSWNDIYWENSGDELSPNCMSNETGWSSWQTSASVFWANTYDDPDPLVFPTKQYQSTNTWVASVARTLGGMGASGAKAKRAYGATANEAFRINSGSWITDDLEYQVNNGDTFQFRIYTPSTLGTTRVTGAIVGGKPFVFTVKTYPDLAEEGVEFPSSGQVGLMTLAETFGPQQAALKQIKIELSDYVRGGPYVHDIAPNAGVPTTLPLKLSDFYSAVGFPELFGIDNIFAVASYPENAEGISDALNAIVGAESEFYWTINSESGPSPTVIQTNPGVYDVANRYLTLRLAGTANTEVIATGSITLHARVIATSEELTFTGRYYLHVIDVSTQ